MNRPRSITPGGVVDLGLLNRSKPMTIKTVVIEGCNAFLNGAIARD
jgi:hypothetical protein